MPVRWKYRSLLELGTAPSGIEATDRSAPIGLSSEQSHELIRGTEVVRSSEQIGYEGPRSEPPILDPKPTFFGRHD
jgi:hypothetical protein